MKNIFDFLKFSLALISVEVSIAASCQNAVPLLQPIFIIPNTSGAPPINPSPGVLPFIEDWGSGGFDQNGWAFDPDQSNWSIDSVYGNPEPSATFAWSPELTNYSSAVVTPLLNAAGITDNIVLNFDIELNNFSTATVECMAVEVFDGSTWQLIRDYTNVNGSFPFISESFDITSFASGHDFSVRFRAHGESSFNINYWFVDNIRVYNRIVGNLTGIITRLSDGAPVENATISIVNDQSGAYIAVSDTNGLYSIDSIETGIYLLTANKEGFNPIADSIPIAGYDTLTRDYALTAPTIGIDTDSLMVTIAIGGHITRDIIVANTGNGPLNWSSYIRSTNQKAIVHKKSNGKSLHNDAPPS
ncbi:MAG: carboxypeptidase-like regulatory domain-containing protein, partial [Bacteroidales bacterium]|nr:carboxypeptidase-like regulatory domain-containing protein [Bacteroidales bacterium]